MHKIFGLTKLTSKNKAQTLSEYAIVIAMVAAAIISMNIFIKRSVQAVVYDTLNQYGNLEYSEEYNPLLGGEKTGSQSNALTRAIYNEFGDDGIEHTNINQFTNTTGYSNREEIIE